MKHFVVFINIFQSCVIKILIFRVTMPNLSSAVLNTEFSIEFRANWILKTVLLLISETLAVSKRERCSRFNKTTC